MCDQRILIRGTTYTAILIVSLNGISDVFITEGTMNGERFLEFIRNILLPHLRTFNGINPHSIVIMDNASIHHIDDVIDLIKRQAGAKVIFLPPYSPELNPAERSIQSSQKYHDKTGLLNTPSITGNDFCSNHHPGLPWTHLQLWI